MNTVNKEMVDFLLQQTNNGVDVATIEANLYSSGGAYEGDDVAGALVGVAQALEDLWTMSGRVQIPYVNSGLNLIAIANRIRLDVQDVEINGISTDTALTVQAAVASLLSASAFSLAAAAGTAIASPLVIGATLVGFMAAGLTVLAAQEGNNTFIETDTILSGLSSLGVNLSEYINSVSEVDLGDQDNHFEGSEFRQEVLGGDGDDTISTRGGSDFAFGNQGNDALFGGDGDDFLFGDAGNDRLTGGPGVDYLEGGSGADQFLWNTGDGDDVIGDYDDGGDRIVVNGLDLATLQFRQLSQDSIFYIDSAEPHIMARYEGDFLAIKVGPGQGEGGITATQYAAVAGQDYGISLLDYVRNAPQPADVVVQSTGPGDGEVDPSAFWREATLQGNVDWSLSTIRFEANETLNYTPGSLHGTLGGAFEGGPLADYLSGGSGSNALHGLRGDDMIYGEAGDDFLEGGAGSDDIQGGDGDDILFGSSRAGLVDSLDPGSDQGAFYLAQGLDAPGDINTIAGNAGADSVTGGRYQDYIVGGAGSDRLFGGGGEDYISGGADHDVIYGDSALHYRHIDQGGGNLGELLQIAFADGQDGSEHYDDELLGGDGNDILWGETGSDVLHGQAGDDMLLGDRVHDVDYFDAELAAYGTTVPALAAFLHGDDHLYGGDGSDLLMGHGGSDLLIGGSGSDSLLGGAGDDVYSFQPGDGLDFIDDTEGFHTLLFTGISLLDVQVRFQGEQVFVGTGQGAEGFYLAASEWPRVKIAFDAPDSEIERSVFETLFLDESGTPMITVPGTVAMTEAERAAIYTIDTNDLQAPRIVGGAAVDEAEVEALSGGAGGAILRLSSGGLALSLQLGPGQIIGGLDFIELAEGVVLGLAGFSGDILGTDAADYIAGSEEADDIHAGGGDDFIEARGGNDELYGGWGRDTVFGGSGDDHLDGGTGDDLLDGGAGEDYLYGGQGTDRDILVGGTGDDVLAGGYGPDIYRFSPGDGQDRLNDPAGYHYFEFSGDLAAEHAVLHFTGNSERQFRFEYGQSDAFTSNGTTSAHYIRGISLNGLALPLVQRSDLVDGTFHDTRSDDVFEMGDGQDTAYVSGWGSDVVRVFTGDGEDSVVVAGGGSPALKGQIRLGADVDLTAVSFNFLNGDALIQYGETDQLTIDTDTVATHLDNVLGRFTVVSESNPDWIPTIRAVGYVGELHGSYGADYLIGNANAEIIVPGYGNDLVQAGAGPDWIVMNDLYMYQAQHGIGHKSLSGGAGNDTLLAPLHQGLEFHYEQGDGHDSIEYDWSYSHRHPYRFTVDYAADTFTFNPHGQDSLVFGAGISLEDLRFIRFGDSMELLLRDGSGGLRIDNFFLAYDAQPDGPVPHVYELFGEGPTPETLDYPGLVSALPSTPVANIQFADGGVYDMAALLASRLQVEPDYRGVLTSGGSNNDQLAGTEGDDAIYAFEGDDVIQEFGGSNIIDAGSGDDVIELFAGTNTILFGSGSGHDLLFLEQTAGELVLEMVEGVDPADISVAYESGSRGEAAVLYLSPGADSLELLVSSFDAETGSWAPGSPDDHLVSVRFADGMVIPLEEFPGPVSGEPGDVIVGSSQDDVLIGSAGNDSLTGGEGDDLMFGGEGDDTFFVQGLGHGEDRISGKTGYDRIVGGPADDRITLKSLLLADSIEMIDGGAGVNVLSGSGRGNKLDLSATELRNIAAIEGGAGNDSIFASPGSDVIIGGAGDDRLTGGGGSDTYLFAAGDGRDRISNNDTSGDSEDVLHMVDADYHDLWFSRTGQHLLVDVVGSSDQVRIDGWYRDDQQQLDEIHAGDQVLYRDQVDQLVNAMAAFDVPHGVGDMLPTAVQSQLEPILAAAWLESA